MSKVKEEKPVVGTLNAYEHGNLRGYNNGYKEGCAEQLEKDIKIAQDTVCMVCKNTQLDSECSSCIMRDLLKNSLEAEKVLYED